MTTRILVTGAAGTIGRAVLAELVSRPDTVEIVAFDRDCRAARHALRRFAGEVRLVFGDITRPETLAPACTGIDTALHLAAVLPPLADARPALAKTVNLGGTKALITALEAQSPGAFLVYASSIAVYGDRLDSPEIRVGDPVQPAEGDAYAASKIAAEAAVRASRLDWTILRLTAIMGGHRMTPLIFHMPLDTRIEIATPGDVARALAAAPGARAALRGRVFNLGGGPRCRTTYRDFLDRSFAGIGLGRLDFPEAAFATRNFHCGIYADGDALEEILRFRRDGLEEHFAAQARALPGWQRLATRTLRRPIKARLLAQSEPLQALKRGDAGAIARYFGDRPPQRPAA